MSTPFFPEVTAAWIEATIQDDEIPAKPFLQAAGKFIPIFDRLGKVFYPVKADIGGNVERMLKALEANPQPTLHKLILAEKATGKHKDKSSTANALLWFKRAMQFIFLLLKKVADGVEANKAAKEAYAETLANYHGFMVKSTFQAGLMAAPNTESMVKCLGTDKDSVLHEMKQWVDVASPFLENIHTFLIKEGLDDGSKV